MHERKKITKTEEISNLPYVYVGICAWDYVFWIANKKKPRTLGNPKKVNIVKCKNENNEKSKENRMLKQNNNNGSGLALWSVCFFISCFVLRKHTFFFCFTNGIPFISSNLIPL